MEAPGGEDPGPSQDDQGLVEILSHQGRRPRMMSAKAMMPSTMKMVQSIVLPYPVARYSPLSAGTQWPSVIHPLRPHSGE